MNHKSVVVNCKRSVFTGGKKKEHHVITLREALKLLTTTVVIQHRLCELFVKTKSH